MDKTGADFYKCMQDIVDRLGAKRLRSSFRSAPRIIQGLVDLVRMKAWSGKEEKLDAKFVDIDIPADMVEKAKEYRESCWKAAVELDDEVLSLTSTARSPDDGIIHDPSSKAAHPVLKPAHSTGKNARQHACGSCASRSLIGLLASR